MTNKLSEKQINELKRAFSVIDKDGNGAIGVQEIALVIKLLDPTSNINPSEQEVLALMRLMDKNHDGSIQLEEFMQAMADWLSSDPVTKTGLKKRKRSEAFQHEREEIHKKVSKFFLQFRTNKSFDKIRANVNNLLTDNHFQKLSLDDEDIDVEMREAGEITEEERKLIWDQLRKINLPETIGQLLNAQNPQEAFGPLHQCVRVLRIVLFYKTPAERREIADDLVNIFKAFIPAFPRLVKLVRFQQSPRLQLECLKALTLLIPGPKIGSTPEDHMFHPSKMFFKTLLQKENGVQDIANLLQSPYNEIREQAILAIGQFCAQHPEMRDYALNFNIVKPIVAQFGGVFANPQQPNIALMRKGTWCLSILCGYTHNIAPDWQKVKDAIPLVSQLIYHFGQQYDDPRVLSYVCSCLAFLLPGVHEETICKRLIELLRLKSAVVVEIVLKTLNKLFMADEFIVQTFLKQEFAGIATVLLQHSDIGIRSTTLRCLSTTIGLRGHVQDVIDANTVPLICNMILSDPLNRSKALKIIKYLTRGSASHVRYLVKSCDIITVLCNVLTFFKENEDKVLQKVYNFQGSTYNFELVNDAVVSIMNIIHAGEMEAEQTKQLENPYIYQFDAGCIDKLGTLLALIKAAPKHEIDAWRTGNEFTVEDQVKALLTKIKEVADHKLTKYPGAKTISDKIQHIFSLYYDKKAFDESQYVIQSFLSQYKQERERLLKLTQPELIPSSPQHPNVEFSATNQFVDLQSAQLESRKKVFQDMSKQTQIDVTTLEKLYNWYSNKCNMFGRLKKQEFQQGLVEICQITDPIILDQLFLALDTDHDNEVDFREFVSGLYYVQRKKQEYIQQQENVLRLQFRMYDQDNSGYITIDEVYNLFKAFQDASGKPYHPQELRVLVETTFAAADQNHDGKIDFEEFKAAIRDNKLKAFNIVQ
jgi:serine/threonine-protein phosphatase 2B regulatory subunit